MTGRDLEYGATGHGQSTLPTEPVGEVLFIGESGDGQAISHYRCRLPALGLAQRGWRAQVSPVAVGMSNGMVVGWDGDTSREWIPPDTAPGVVIFRALKDPLGHELDSVDMFLSARVAGQMIFTDLDDDLWHLPAWNPAADVWTPDQLAVLERNLNACDGIFCSTSPLAAVVAEHTDTPTFVAPPSVDLAEYNVARHQLRPTGIVRVGWCGLTSWRGRDLEWFAADLRDILNAHAHHAELWHIGAHPRQPPIRWPLGPVSTVVRELPWAKWFDLPAALAQLDVAVIPMDPSDPVNTSRSATMGLALAAAGVAVITSTNESYTSMCLGENLRPCWSMSTDAQGLGDILTELLDAGPSTIIGRGANAREGVARWSPRNQADHWETAFHQLVH